jgi:hypothetical protein
MALNGLSSNPTDLWYYFLRNGQLPGADERQPGDKVDAIDISSLPPELRQIIESQKSQFSEGDPDRIDTENEARKLMEAVLAQEGRTLPNAPGAEALGNLSKDDLMALLVDWILSKQSENKPGANRGDLSGHRFTGGGQPTSWSGGGSSAGTRSGGNNPSGAVTPSTAGAQGTADVSAFNNLSAEQKQNAQTIINVGRQRGASERDIQIALMTAMQESGLRNLNHGDRDSLGLFQQRPSQGWGTPAQVTDPNYAANKFYDHLLRLPNRDNMRLTEAAQAVQRSAYPEAYAKHEGVALAILQNLG